MRMIEDGAPHDRYPDRLMYLAFKLAFHYLHSFRDFVSACMPFGAPHDDTGLMIPLMYIVCFEEILR